MEMHADKEIILSKLMNGTYLCKKIKIMSSITLNFNNRKDIELMLSLLRRMHFNFEVATPVEPTPNPKDAAVDALFGSWESNLSADEMVKMIYDGRINQSKMVEL